MIFVDSNVVLDVVTADPVWSRWSQTALERAASRDQLAINNVIYAELSIRYARIEDLEVAIEQMRLLVEPIPRTGLFLAGKVFQRYRASGGTRAGVLPDFFIGAHAMVVDGTLVTRDVQRYRTYFPKLALIAPP